MIAKIWRRIGWALSRSNACAILARFVSCEQRIDRALRRLPGVEHAQASVQMQQVKVTIDPNQVSLQQVQARLEQLGYEVAAV